MPAGRAPSRIRTVLLVTVIVAAGAAALAAGVPLIITVLVTSGIGSAVVAGDLGKRRLDRAEEQAPTGAMERFALVFPAERVAVGGRIQPRFLPSVKKVWAPGALGVAPGEVEFFPSKGRLADKAWRGPVERAEILKTPWPFCFVRVHGANGSAQFALQLPAGDVRTYLTPHLVLDG